MSFQRLNWYILFISGDWIASNVDDIRDDDALEVYGQEDTSTVQLASYNFEVKSLYNLLDSKM